MFCDDFNDIQEDNIIKATYSTRDASNQEFSVY